MELCFSQKMILAAWVQVRRYEAHVLYAPIPLRTCVTGVPMRENIFWEKPKTIKKPLRRLDKSPDLYYYTPIGFEGKKYGQERANREPPAGERRRRSPVPNTSRSFGIEPFSRCRRRRGDPAHVIVQEYPCRFCMRTYRGSRCESVINKGGNTGFSTLVLYKGMGVFLIEKKKGERK